MPSDLFAMPSHAGSAAPPTAGRAPGSRNVPSDAGQAEAFRAFLAQFSMNADAVKDGSGEPVAGSGVETETDVEVEIDEDASLEAILAEALETDAAISEPSDGSTAEDGFATSDDVRREVEMAPDTVSDVSMAPNMTAPKDVPSTASADRDIAVEVGQTAMRAGNAAAETMAGTVTAEAAVRPPATASNEGRGGNAASGEDDEASAPNPPRHGTAPPGQSWTTAMRPASDLPVRGLDARPTDGAADRAARQTGPAGTTIVVPDLSFSFQTVGLEGPRPAMTVPMPAPVSLPQLRDGLSEQARALAERARTEIRTSRIADGGLTTEMELAPAELGRLRLVLQTGERGLHLSVVVDRPESLEIVRRHLDGLHRGLLNEGVRLDGVDISAGGRERPSGDRLPRHAEGQPGPAGSGDRAPDAAADPTAATDTGRSARISAAGRLDIRL